MLSWLAERVITVVYANCLTVAIETQPVESALSLELSFTAETITHDDLDRRWIERVFRCATRRHKLGHRRSRQIL